MRKSGLRAVAAIIMTCLTLALLGCLELFFPSNADRPGLVVLAPTELSSSMWTVVITAENIPDGGLAGILIENGGFVFANVIASSIEAVGMGGFVVTAQNFEEGSPSGMLIAIHTSAGIANGKVLKLTFLARGDPTVTIDETKIILSTDLNTLLQ